MNERITIGESNVLHASNAGTSYAYMICKDGTNHRKEVAEYILSSEVDENNVASVFANVVRQDILAKITNKESADRMIEDINKALRLDKNLQLDQDNDTYIKWQTMRITDGDTEYRIIVAIRRRNVEIIIIMNVSDQT